MNKLSTERAIDDLDTVRAYYASLTAGYPKGKDCKGIDDVMCSEIANACLMGIKALEQEPCEDVVSRNAIIQTLNNMDRYVANELILCDTNNKFPQNEVFIVDDVFEQIAEQLPSVTPKQQTCEDCISRQAAIDCLNADFTIDGKENMETVVDYINGAFKKIKALTSITPQQRVGRWINKYAEDACGERYSYWACSECGRDVGFNLTNIEDVLSDYPYCHCGAKMVEPQESEVKP